MFKKIIISILAIICAFSILTYGGASVATAAESETSQASETAAAEAFPLTITDVVGNELTLEAPATKLVGTHNPTMNTAVVLGGGGSLIAGFGNKEMADKLYSYVYPELANDVIQIGKGKNINYETVMTTGADLAILPERFAYMVEEFNDIGIPAIVILSSTESFDTIKNAQKLLGQVVDKNERAQELIDLFDSTIAKMQAISSETDKTVIFLGGDNMTSVAPGAMIQSEIMEAVGAQNAVTGVDVLGSFADVNAEEIIGWNPDVIWIPQYATYTVDDVLNSPDFSSVTAVKNGDVYMFPSALEPWDYPTVSCCLGVCWAMHNLHPDLYSLDQLVEDANNFYNVVYGMTFTAEEMGLTE